MIRCLLVDDHPVVRAGYGRLLELAGMRVMAEAGDVAAGYAAFLTHRPDVTVTDLSLPGVSGLELARRIQAHSSAAVLVFSMLDPVVAAPLAAEAGASGFVSKDAAPDVLIEAVRAVSRGGRWFPQAPAGAEEDWRVAGLHALSERELEVLRLLALGRSPDECATALHLSRKTVANYQTRIREKLGIDNAAALVHFALRHGLLGGPVALGELATYSSS